MTAETRSGLDRHAVTVNMHDRVLLHDGSAAVDNQSVSCWLTNNSTLSYTLPVLSAYEVRRK